VSVNGTLAAHRPYGYSNFFVPIDHLLRRDAENELRVVAHAGDDSRWYTGAGIYRNVWLLQSGRVHLAPETLEVRTPEIDTHGAAVTVAIVVRNLSATASQSRLRIEVLEPDGADVAGTDAAVASLPGAPVPPRS